VNFLFAVAAQFIHLIYRPFSLSPSLLCQPANGPALLALLRHRFLFVCVCALYPIGNARIGKNRPVAGSIFLPQPQGQTYRTFFAFSLADVSSSLCAPVDPESAAKSQLGLLISRARFLSRRVIFNCSARLCTRCAQVATEESRYVFQATCVLAS
jgi:hypothetical protein